jgi:hypothetical protein
MQQEVKHISNFYSQFAVASVDEETQIVRSPDHDYLVKLINLDHGNANIDDVI